VKIETRYLPACELRIESGTDLPQIVGYAAVFHALSHDLGGFKERIQPGAFREALAAQPDVRALVDHNPSFILGRTKSGTLTLTEDERGLHVVITPPDTALGRDLLTSLRRGDIDGMSFAFRAVKDTWSKQDGLTIRELQQVDLFDVSVVGTPAYPDTSVAVRSLESWQRNHFDPAQLKTLACKLRQASL
jgi:HK97 family phage prohead protease